VKERVTYSILAILLGGIGVHRFYVGQWGKGLLYVLFCMSFIPALIGLIEGIVWLTRSDEQFQAHLRTFMPPSAAEVAAREAANAELAAQRAAERRAAQELRRNALVEKFGEQLTEIILAGKIREGMPLAAVVESLGRPGDTKEDRNKGVVKLKLFYEPYTNSQKKTSYRREVRVEDGIVTGWKDL